jgi:glutamyl-Q tRNA(Asp) synthetase
MTTPVFRFAPSPNGRLHLGHAASALLNARLAAETGGRFLLRIEDIDVTRCRPEHERAIRDDLAWLGLRWEEPVMRQSERFGVYAQALDALDARDLLYPCFCSRKRIAADSAASARDPDGAPLYAGRCRVLPPDEAARRKAEGEPFALRLRMDATLAAAGEALTWREGLPGRDPAVVAADPARWGDVVLKRKEFPASYHLAVVVDDAEQGVTHVVRGRDLYEATAVHRLLQRLLGLAEPRYLHHALVRDEAGAKLSKSLGARSLADLRAEGMQAADVRRLARLDA